MYFLEHEPDIMAPFLRGLLKRFLSSRINNPGLSSSASYSYLQVLRATKVKVEETEQVAFPVTSEKYNLETISGL